MLPARFAGSGLTKSLQATLRSAKSSRALKASPASLFESWRAWLCCTPVNCHFILFQISNFSIGPFLASISMQLHSNGNNLAWITTDFFSRGSSFKIGVAQHSRSRQGKLQMPALCSRQISRRDIHLLTPKQLHNFIPRCCAKQQFHVRTFGLAQTQRGWRNPLENHRQLGDQQSFTYIANANSPRT